MGKSYTGFEMGSSTLKVAVCDGETIKDIALEPMPDGLFVDGRVVSIQAMGDFIKTATANVQGLSKQAAFVIPQADSLTRRIEIPAMTIKELDINLPYEFRDFITQDKDKYVYDYAVLNSVVLPDGTPDSFDILAVAASKAIMSDYADMFRRAGFKLSIATPIAAALQNLIVNNPLALPNCCIIDFAYSSTLLHFFVNGVFDVSRSIEIGIADIDRAIADTHNVDIHTAANYRQSNFQHVFGLESVRDICENISVEVGRALNFHSFNSPNAAIAIAYLSGEGMLIPPLVDAVSNRVEIEKRDIAEIMPLAQNNDNLKNECPGAVGITMV